MELSETAKKTLSLGFIGVGWIGRNRMEAILKDSNAEALSIAEPVKENATEALKIADSAEIKEIPDSIYKDDRLDGIVIATPSAMHAEQSIDTLNSGKAVFCQKPLGRTEAEVREVVAASAKANKLLEVDLSYRYVKAFQAVHSLIKNKEIGEVYAVNLTFHNAYGPDKKWFYDIEKSGGGCVMDLGIHLVDMALWCLNFPEIKEVQSRLFNKGQKITSVGQEVEDFADVSIISEENTSINLQCSWNVSAGKDAVIEVEFFGTKGGAAVKNVNGSFYDFTAEKYQGTQAEILETPPDNWSGRAGVVWAEKLLSGTGYDAITAEEFIKTAQLIDRIYGR